MLTRRALLRPFAAAIAATALAGGALATGARAATPGPASQGSKAVHGVAHPPRETAERIQAALDTGLAAWLGMHPEEATRIGEHRFDRRLPSASRRARREDLQPLEQARDQVERAGAHASGAPIVLEPTARLFLSRVAAASGDSLSGSATRPFDALARLHLALEEPLRGGYASPCIRAARLTSRLRGIPEYVRALQVDMSDGAPPARVAIDASLEEIETLIDLCRRAPIPAFDDCREGAVQADFAVADSQAVRALEEFRDELRDQARPRANAAIEDSSSIAPALLAVSAGGSDSQEAAAFPASEPGSPRAVLARIRSELASLGPAEPTVREGASRGRLTVADAAARIDTVRAAIARERLVTLERKRRLIASGLPPLPGDDPPQAYWVPGPWDRRSAAARLDLGGWPSGRSGALAADPMRSLAALELCVARDGIPGRAAWAYARARLPSRLRQAVELTPVSDGWARYVEAMWVERNSGRLQAEMEREHRALERERLARAAVELMLRVERTPPDSAAAWLATAAGLAVEDARRATLRACVAPSFAAGTVAMWSLLELRADLRRELGPRFRLGAFHDAVLGAGGIPMHDLRDEVRSAMLETPGRKR